MFIPSKQQASINSWIRHIVPLLNSHEASISGGTGEIVRSDGKIHISKVADLAPWVSINIKS